MCRAEQFRQNVFDEQKDASKVKKKKSYTKDDDCLLERRQKSKSLLEQEAFGLHPSCVSYMLPHRQLSSNRLCIERSPTNKIKVEFDEFVIHPKTF